MENTSSIIRITLKCQGNFMFVPKVIYRYIYQSLSAPLHAGGQMCIYVVLWNILSGKVMLLKKWWGCWTVLYLLGTIKSHVPDHWAEKCGNSEESVKVEKLSIFLRTRHCWIMNDINYEPQLRFYVDQYGYIVFNQGETWNSGLSFFLFFCFTVICIWKKCTSASVFQFLTFDATLWAI